MFIALKAGRISKLLDIFLNAFLVIIEFFHIVNINFLRNTLGAF